MRIVNAKKSRYYDAALDNFRRARQCFDAAGLTAEWENTAVQVRAEHRRKTAFIAGFEEIVAGSTPRVQLSFLQRAKANWSGRLPK